MRLSTRIFIGFALIVGLFASASGFSVTKISAIRADLARVQSGYLALARKATQLRTLHTAKLDIVDRAMDADVQAARQYFVRSATEFYPRSIRKRTKEMRETLADLRRVAKAKHDIAFATDIATRINSAQKKEEEHDTLTRQLFNEADDALLALYKTKSAALSEEVKGLSIAVESKVARALLHSAKESRQAAFASVILAALAFLVALVVLIWVLRSLTPLNALATSVRGVKRGKLDPVAEGSGKDEIAVLSREFNHMIGALKERETLVQDRGAQLQALKALSDDVIRSVGIGIVLIDAEGLIERVNPAARSVFGVPLVDLEKRPLEEMLEQNPELSAVLESRHEVLKGGESREFKGLHLGERLADVALVPIRDSEGTARDALLLLGEDVTLREQTREKLVESERLAAIGRLAAQITHEIRNPLSSVALNIELLGDDVEFLPDERQSEARSILKAVGTEVDRLTEITEGYLRYARLPARKTIEGDVGDLLADLCAFSQGEASKEGVMLELRVDDNLPKVPHDPPRLRQAFLNLLRNGMEAAGPGGTVRLCAQKASTGVLVRVEDSGEGVPENVRERLFEPFFTTKSEGTGLGLTLTKEIVADHRGILSLMETDLGGAAFEITLPDA